MAIGTVQSYLLVGIGLFLCLVFYLSYLGWEQTETISDFAIASERLGPYTLGAAFAATYFSAGTFVSYVSWSYRYGFSNLWLYLAMISAAPIGLILFARRVRVANIEQGSLSLPDWLGDFYQSDLLRAGVAFVVLFNIFYIAGQFSGGAIAFQLMLDLDYTTSATIIAAIVTLYILAGGTYADVYTDAFQSILMAIMSIIVFMSVFYMFDTAGMGVFTDIGAALEAQNSNLVAPINPDSEVFYNVVAIVSVFVLQFALAAQPQLVNKVLSIDSPENLKKMIATYVVLTVAFLTVIFCGFYLRALRPNVANPDQAIFIYVLEYFPALLAAFLGVVILAATLSTTDGLVVVLATAVANDIFKKIIVERGYIQMDNETADRVAQRIAMLTTVIVGIVAYLIVLSPPSNLGLFIWFGVAGAIAGTVAPVLIGIYLPSFATKEGAIASLVTGTSAYLLLSLVIATSESVFVQGTGAVIVSVVTMVLVSAVTEQEDGVGSCTERTHSGRNNRSDDVMEVDD